MNDKISPPPRLIRPSEEVDAACDAFEAAWQRGDEPRIEDFLDRASEANRRKLLRELLLAEWDIRGRRALSLDLETYQRRFSGEERVIGEAWEAWYVGACQTGETMKPAQDEADTSGVESLDLSIRCPHCQSRVDLPEGGAAEIVCEQCGSSFRLERDVTVSWQAGSGRGLGRFQLIEPVGSGAFGTVYKARDPELDRTVAIKVPRASHLADPEFHDRFVREAKSAASLRHPSIVPIHEVGQHEGTPYLISEFVEGVTLADSLSARRLSHREAAELIAELAEALEYAHARGVIHRDVKPSNVLLDDERRPHLMDFGLAKRDAGDVTMTMDGQVLGTPAYMSPEQARGEGHSVDSRADVYSLGVILYQLLTGELPFRGTTRMLLYQVLHNEPRRPRCLNDRIPRDLETICLKAMAKEPLRRYTTAGELAADLRRYVAGKPIRARRITSFERGWRWCKRNPGISGLAAAFVLALMLGTTIASWQAYVANQQRQLAQIESQHAAAAEQRARSEARQKELEAERATRSEYIANMNLMQHDWEQNNVGRLWDSLDVTKSYPRRGFEWYYWHYQLDRSIQTFRGHLNRIGAVAVSPDERRLATVSNDQAIKIWDIDTGRELFTLHGHTGWIRSVAFLDDQRIVTSSDDLTARVWDLSTKRELLVLPVHTADRIFSGLSADGRRLVTGSYDRTARIWDTHTGERLKSIDVGSRVWSVAISPDGRRIVTGGEQGECRVWDLEGQREPIELAHPDKVWCIAFSPDGDWIITGCEDHTAKVWDASDGTLIDTLEGHKGRIFSAVFSHSGRKIATASSDGTATIWTWNGKTAEATLHLKAHRRPIWSVAFLPGNKSLVTGSADGTARLWDLTVSEPLLLMHESNVLSVAFVTGGERVVSLCADGLARLWNVENQEIEKEFHGRQGQAVTCVAVSPTGDWIVTGDAGGEVQSWSVRTDRRRWERPLEHGAAVTAVGVSPDGQWIATAESGGPVKLWDASRGVLRSTLHDDSPGRRAVAFSHDSRSVVTLPVGSDTATVWETASGRQQGALTQPGASMRFLATSPDAPLIVLGGHDESQDLILRLWDLDAGRPLRPLRGHTDPIFAACFSPDGRRIVTVGWDAMARLWDTSTGRELLALHAKATRIEQVAFSPDGRRIATASPGGTVQIWTAATEAQVAAWEKEEEAGRRAD